jgi:pimeloyl-ACP methyl ester carboxylesterase
MVCVGDMDTTIPPTKSHIIADTLAARFKLFEGAGHAFAIQEPERYTQVLVSHFEDACEK